mmetsp:Transcript_9242/g.13475  ORF Transcript_9242/g.13475 Transcript_9242/m.13475 type:complete len:782 (-) Transcript_9242:237-2582(-)
MKVAGILSIVSLLLVLSLATVVVHGDFTDPVEIVVGDDPDQFNWGWSDGVCYLPIQNARVGDSISFSFFLHNVYKMPSREAMEKCDFSSATLLASSSPFAYTITSDDGPSLYFACEVGSHCFGEQRLEVEVEQSTSEPRSSLPYSRFVLGTSSESCARLRRGDISVSDASRGDESDCSPPELREATEDIDRPHYFRSCLGPPITMTPGGVINQASLLHFPFPTDRRVLIGTRVWEFVQGDIGALEPVYVNQLYIHHIAGSVVMGNGAENIRQSEEDAAFPLPFGMLSGDFSDNMLFHLIDLRNTGDQWLECLECRCKNGEGTYLSIGGSGDEGGPGGGVSCCTNCTDLSEPTIDYRLRYNVTYTELADVDVPIDPIVMISTDVAPGIDRYVEWDVAQWQELPPDQSLPENPKVQVVTRVGTLRDLFGGFFPGAKYTGQDLVKVHRCIGHLHVAALGMWLYDDKTNELICHNDVEYGDDPDQDKGFLRSVSVTNYDPPLSILADRTLRIVTHYDAEILHTGVMGLLFLMVSEGLTTVSSSEASLTVDLCQAPTCDPNAILPNGGCRDSLQDSIMCMFGGVCDCNVLLSLPDTIGGCDDGGVYMSNFGNVTVGSLCAQHCGCPMSLLQDSVMEQIQERTEDLCHYAGAECSRYLANLYACAQPWSDGADGFEESVMRVVAEQGKRMAFEGTKLGSSRLHRFDKVKSLEDVQISLCNSTDYFSESESAPSASMSDTDETKFSLIYLFPVVVVGLIAGLALYSNKVRKSQKTIAEFKVDSALEEA